ncbi:hypothetical protein BH24ACT24_BH24ACT24_08040 [soil metagenome]|jgi:uncharacterized protein YlxP (DUF503 family)|nr:DUF503 domain-containing protein [Thermoleophilaceae bacterium]MDQ3241011.1 DUF503 domain-containing protein [Actinomycetota bacterium]MDQ3319456.1 DUF503 domain-containing protein [Actinomycetota bacterium]
MSFLCLIEIELYFPDGGSLKGKRKEIVSLKEQLKRRFGAAVAETEHHELWQRATLTAALVARDARGLEEAAAALERHVLARFGDGVRCEWGIRSAEEVLG